MADIAESPRLADTRIPLCAFCIVSIDFVASVAALQDDQTTAAAALLPRKKYMAIINTPAFIDWHSPPEAQQLGLKFWGVARGLPLTDPTTACVALSPDFVHPSGRAPLLLEKPLPWSDLYVHTLDGLTAKVSRAHLTHPSEIQLLTRDDLRTLRRAKVEDMCEYARLQESKQQPATRTKSSSVASLADNDGLSGAAQNGRGGSGDSGDTSSASSSFDGDNATSGSSGDRSSVEDDYTIEEHPQKVYTHVELWLSLTLNDDEELGDMGQLDAELSALTALEKDWARRTLLQILADQPHTSQWIEDVAAAGTPQHDTQAHLFPKPPSRKLERLVRPEDAIEHRVPNVGRDRRRRKAHSRPQSGRMSLQGPLRDKLQHFGLSFGNAVKRSLSVLRSGIWGAHRTGSKSDTQ